MVAAAMRSLVLLAAFALVLPAGAGPLQTVIERLQSNEGRCTLQKEVDAQTCLGEIDGVEAAPDACCPLTLTPNHTSAYKCDKSGLWIEQGTMVHCARQKRGCRNFGLLIIPVVGWIACIFVCRCDSQPPNSPPTIVCPPSRDVWALKGARSAWVNWSDPIASDQEDKNIKGRLTQGKELRNTMRPPGSYSIQYQVKDSRNALDHCNFQITVKVHYCESLAYPEHGFLSCTDSSAVWGSQCTVTCDPGYEVRGSALFKCEENERWSPAHRPRCQPIECSTLPTVAHGFYNCWGPHTFPSVCALSCESGYTPREPAVVCQADGNFSSPGRCADASSPEFPSGCPSDVEVIAGPPGQLTPVSWTLPAATDNSGTPTLNSTKSPGDGFPLGRTEVVYTATDAEGNLASCHFQVTVNTVSCPMPNYDNSSLNIMVYDCPNGHVAGANCTVSCLLGYPKVGPDLIYCELDTGVHPPSAHWSTRDPNDLVPQCQVLVCPPLSPPKNGALACENWRNGPMCTYLCNANYDIPFQISANPLFICSTSNAIWRPSSAVPDCTERKNPGRANIPSQLYYYTGDCQNATVQEQIKLNFVLILQELQFEVDCPNASSCVTSTVSVTCGPSGAAGRRRRETHVFRRSAYEILVDFTVSVDFVEDGGALESRVRQALRSKADGGDFDVRVGDQNFTAENFVTATTRYSCPEGTLFSPTSRSCAGCSSGSYYNATTTACQDCPVGFYQNESFSLACKPCPPHTTTNSTGKRSVTDCLSLCSPGHFSPSGLAPCGQCEAGSYQPEFGQTYCLSCPANHSTPGLAATSSTSCVASDACLSSPCGNHSCQQGSSLGDFRCTCREGWSGVKCQTPPDLCQGHLCQNEATCVGTRDSYTCSCAEGYFGTYCQEAVVDGAWGGWGDWSQCSITCGGGTRTRRRSCDSPPPGPHGQTCPGVNRETEACNTQTCPVCPDLGRPYGVNFNCTVSEDVTSCSVTCRAGLAFAEAPLPRYECGRASNYTWNHQTPDSPRGRIPECSSVRTALSASTITTVKYGSCQSLGNGNEVLKQVGDSLQNLDCIKKNTCSPDISMAGCQASSRRRRSAGSSAVVSINLTMTDQGTILDLASVENGTVPAPVLDYVTRLLSLDVSAQKLQNNSDNMLTVVIGGSTISPEAINVNGQLHCPSGNMPDGGVCVECPRGTRQEGQSCVLCERGFYQSQSGQTTCLTCPSGMTTVSTGSTDLQNCSVVDEATAGGNPAWPTTTPSPNTGSTGGDSVSQTLAIVLGVVSSVVVVAVITLSVFLCNRARGTGKTTGVYHVAYFFRRGTSKIGNPPPSSPPPYSL